MKETIVTLENETHRARIYLNRGAKTGSFMLKSTGFELLAQPKDARYPPLRPGMPFSEGDASGFDDVFPSMGEEIVILDGQERSMPDQGEIWTLPMRAEISENTATFIGNGRVSPTRTKKACRWKRIPCGIRTKWPTGDSRRCPVYGFVTV